MSDIIENQNGIPFDIDALITDVNGKAEIDFTNVSNLGKSRSANWAMPSSTYEDLTVGAYGATYTAPANGYFVATNQTSQGGRVFLVNHQNGLGITGMYILDVADGTAFVPAKKGDSISLYYRDNNGTTWGVNGMFRFIYAQGSESEAN